MVPFRSILIAADFSEGSREAFRIACSLAGVDETRVFVVGVLEPKLGPESTVYHGQQSVRFVRVPRDPGEHQSLAERLREAYAPGRPLDVGYWTREGEPTEEILRAARETRCDLIVMGTHGRTGVHRLLAGSVAEAVLRQARCPVLALRSGTAPRREGPVGVILHPTDFSEASEPALRVARLLARDQGARLVLLHVTPVEAVGAGMMIGIDAGADRDSLDVLRVRTDGPDLKQPVEIRSELGDAAFEILRVADEVAADLIVMGTHGRTGLVRLLLGSQAEAVLRRACCPVLAVKGIVAGSGAAEAAADSGKLTEVAGGATAP